ncbi:MAG: potassium transporter Kup [Chlorobi bacterium]|nr:MAG: potassium transporter Kup [Bacteroidota bacterium]KXK34355.1 MAG: KUP system potassium uptake protein [Chlorobi bacterium OLB6]MBL1160177.1 potassium transporter Kup [Chlorobiota bacterium]
MPHSRVNTGLTNSTTKQKSWPLVIAALGVVFGDIGTSPLYSVKECFSPHYSLSAGLNGVYGVLSMIFWSLTIVVAIKYIGVISRFDNHGEGGQMALMELVLPFVKNRYILLLVSYIGLFGAALLYGDGMITPAISVLSAVEGVKVAIPSLSQSTIVIATILILFGLFSVQRFGSRGVGRIFGPVMIAWFLVIGTIGAISIVQTPGILAAVNPLYAIEFFSNHGLEGALVLGSVFLVMTGGETVYADLGHFGAKPIRKGWFMLVFPCLLLNYFGQGALLLREGHIASTVANPFFHLVPSWGVIPLVIFSTATTSIASQAVISGAFSLTWQALQLGYLPRLTTVHTSDTERGQIYIPFVNWALFACTVYLVLQFQSSGALAAMYGIAVSTTMVLTTLVAWHAMRHIAKWSVTTSLIVTAIFFGVDISFFLANATKIPDGGYVPLIIAGSVFFLMVTWKRGRSILRAAIQKRTPVLEEIIDDIDSYTTVPGTAIYLSGYRDIAPPALVSNVRYNRCRHEVIILLTVSVGTESHITRERRYEIKPLQKNFYQVVLHYGFMDQLDIAGDIDYLPEFDIPIDITDTTLVFGHETITVTNRKGMAWWRKHIFMFVHRNSRMPVKYFGVPFKRVLEVGSNIEI